jgi:hypothetical protein
VSSRRERIFVMSYSHSMLATMPITSLAAAPLIIGPESRGDSNRWLPTNASWAGPRPGLFQIEAYGMPDSVLQLLIERGFGPVLD